MNGVREKEIRTPARSLTVGVGARRGVSAAEVCGAIEEVLRRAGLPPDAVARLATVDARAAEPGTAGAARRLGVPLCSYSPAALATVDVPNPSQAALRSAGTPSVAEAAALLAAGENARLLVAKSTPATAGAAEGPSRVTVAVAHGALSGPHPNGPGRRTTRGGE